MMIYLHIGLPKSGSSAIQVYLNEKAEELKKYGVLYPWSHSYAQMYRTSGGNARPLLKTARSGYIPEDTESLTSSFFSFAEEYEKVVISSEALSVFFGKENPENLFKLVPKELPVKVVIYLRNQVDKFVSDVNQTIKNARRNSYKIDEPWFLFNNYYNQIKWWERVFGKENLIIRGYNKKQFVNGDAVEDFCSCIDIPFLGYDKELPINPSLKLPYLEVMRCVNVLAHADGDYGWRVKNKIKDHIWRSSVESDYEEEKRLTFVSKDTLLEIQERLQESNDHVVEEYGVSGLDLASAIQKYEFAKPMGNEMHAARSLFNLAKTLV